jgi:hypothetical protein
MIVEVKGSMVEILVGNRPDHTTTKLLAPTLRANVPSNIQYSETSGHVIGLSAL